MSEPRKNASPLCKYCKPMKQAEWEFVYGDSPTHDYAFCCTDHIPDLIKSISSGKHGPVRLGYLQHWDTEAFFDPTWQKRWSEFYRRTTGTFK